MIFRDDFKSDVGRVLERDQRQEKERFISKNIASYFNSEYNLEAEVTRIVTSDKSDSNKGVVTIAIAAIGNDVQVPYRVEEGEIILESDSFERKLGLRKFNVNVSGSLFETKAFNPKHASEKLAKLILDEYPVVSLDNKRYDKKSEKFLSTSIEKRIVESFNKEKIDEEEYKDQIPDIVVEKTTEKEPVSHISPLISVDSEFSDSVKEDRQYQKLIDMTSDKITNILTDIDENLELDEIHIDSVVPEEDNKNEGNVTGSVRIVDKDFSVNMRYTASIKESDIQVDGLFDLIKGYYKIKGYSVPMGEDVYKVEASSKKAAIVKVLNYLMKENKDCTYDGRKIIPENVEFIADIILNEKGSEIEETKVYDQALNSVNSDERWKVDKQSGDIYLHKLLDQKDPIKL